MEKVKNQETLCKEDKKADFRGNRRFRSLQLFPNIHENDAIKGKI
jgi:hypothetical protein